jgi:hypothetical protein
MIYGPDAPSVHAKVCQHTVVSATSVSRNRPYASEILTDSRGRIGLSLAVVSAALAHCIHTRTGEILVQLTNFGTYIRKSFVVNCDEAKTP